MNKKFKTLGYNVDKTDLLNHWKKEYRLGSALGKGRNKMFNPQD
jgi:hypothetical protein